MSNANNNMGCGAPFGACTTCEHAEGYHLMCPIDHGKLCSYKKADNYLDGDYIPDHLDGIEIDGALTEDKFRAVGIELQLSFDERTDKHVGFLISFNEAKDLLARLTNN